MDSEAQRLANEETRQAWQENAPFWDERMGEGNDFVEILTWPPTLQVLEIRPGDRVLDIACGNGLTSRRLAAKGARVVAFDFAEEMIARARRRTVHHRDRITCFVVDATEQNALLRLGLNQFDAALCHMALFDMAQVRPLLRALAKVLKGDGRFVFSVLHPCFNGPGMTQLAEREERDGEVATGYSVKVRGYLTPSVTRAAAIRGQPRPQLMFHRPLSMLFGACFEAGFVMDRLIESAFPPDYPAGRDPLSASRASPPSHLYPPFSSLHTHGA
jgi:2-polyprenyl-3-methyl-5-hydroxy-6-metoxy-1,4-benzoquinol methylase